MEGVGRNTQQFESLRREGENSEEEILASFSEEERAEIKRKQKVLSSLAYFIGKDFEIPVELNTPGEGWHWDFKENKIRIDPKDLLEKPLDYLRFVISHEGGHRRISRTDCIPPEEWSQPGFAFMMNAIEDPRDNNFVAENYPKFEGQMEIAYRFDMDVENKYREKAKEKLGRQPRFMQAGFEYIKLWFKERNGEQEDVSPDLPEEVREVVRKTMEAAKDSWWRYPSRQEADESEERIREYARVSYEINRDEIWPEFKKLVEADMNDQQMQELMQEMQSSSETSEGEGGRGESIPQELRDGLTSEEQKELKEAIEKAIEEAKKTNEGNGEEKGGEGERSDDSGEGSQGKTPSSGKPIDLDAFSDGLKEKIRKYLDSLPEDKKKELREKAQGAIRELEREINEELEGKLSENPEERVRREDADPGPEEIQSAEPKERPQDEWEEEQKKQREKDIKAYQELLETSLRKDDTLWEEYRGEVLPIIDRLENDLREIFVARRAGRWQGGYKTGKRIGIKTRIQEKAKGISAVESRAWQKRELPTEKDYAISLLVDLSGSMRGGKIRETFKAIIVLAEVLNRLSIPTEILGFNDRLYEYQTFGEDLNRDIRENMGGVIREVDAASRGEDGHSSSQTDTGWATKIASDRLAKRRASEKFLLTLSDGLPEESPDHSGPEFDLSRVVSHIMQETDQKLIGLGIGDGTQHVERFYPNSLANIDIEEMAEKLAGVIKEMIENYRKF